MSVVSSIGSCFSAFPSLNKSKRPAVVLAAMVFFAGATTTGVGYLPCYWFFCSGMGSIDKKLAVASVLLAASFYCRNKFLTNSVKERTSASFGAFWLPDEIWERIIGNLEFKELGNAFLTCKSWNKLVKKNFSSLKKANPKQIIFQNLGTNKISSAITVDNHLVFHGEDSSALYVWKIEKGKLVLRCASPFKINMQAVGQLGYANDMVYILSVAQVMRWNLQTGMITRWSQPNGCALFVDQEKIMLAELKQISFRYKETFKQFGVLALQLNKFLLYKNTLVFVPREDKQLKIREMNSALEENILSFRNFKDILFFVSHDVLVIQKVPEESDDILPDDLDGRFILRYDLEAKKWLAEIDPGKGWILVGALCGRIVVVNKRRVKAKIFDFR